MTTFGYKEAEELRAAINTLAARNDVDPTSFGLWGYNLGAYAAMREAETDKRVRVLVLDSVYDEPKQMVRVEVENTGLASFPFMVRSAELSFDWLNYQHKQDPPLSTRLSALAGVPKLFIEANDQPELAELTRDIFVKAPEPREQAMIPHGNFAGMGDEDKRAYLHRGIAARQFQRAFVLADAMEVREANLENGLLTIELERPEPEHVIRRIEIKGA